MRSVSGRRQLVLLLYLALGLCACTAKITSDAPWQRPDSSPIAGQSPAVAGNGAVGSTAAAASGGSSCDQLVDARAVLVAPRQYVNVLRDLIGSTAVTDQDAAASSEFVFDTVDRPLMTTATLDRYVRLAEQATETLRGHSATFLGCKSSMDTACVSASLQRVAHRAFKRPISADELAGLMAVQAAGAAAEPNDQGETGVLAALQALLIAPSTLYRTEFTAPVNGTSRTLTVYERAAALAALLLDSVPDQPLLAAADDGSLATDAGLLGQIDRLLALPRVRQHLTTAVLNAYNVPRVFSSPKDATLFPDYSGDLQNSMYEETRRFVEDVLWTRNAPIGELLTGKHSFVDAALAKLYGLPAPVQAFASVDLPPERAGLLTQASVLSVLSRTDKNSVVARGLFIRGNVLCMPKIPGPPASVQAQVMAQLGAKSSQKELAAYRAMTSPCMGCHSQFDRFGLVLESFDPIGRRSATPAESVDLTGLGNLTGTVASYAELAARLAQDHSFERCFGDRTLGFALTTAVDSDKLCLGTLRDPQQLQRATIRDVIVAIAQSPTWSARSAEL